MNETKNYILDLLREQLSNAIEDMRYHDAKDLIEAIIALESTKFQ